MKSTTIAVDLAKSVFQDAVSQRPGKVSESHRLTRKQFLRFFGERQPALVLLEACGTAHYWARELRAIGHQVELLPPHVVRRYVNRNKTDRTDAKGLLEAHRSDDIRCVCRLDVAVQDPGRSTLGPPKSPLAVDDHRLFRVRAHEPLNRTELVVSPGEVYSIQPRRGCWVDWFIPCGPAGYHTPWTDRFKSKLRNPHAPFFALMVTVGDDDSGSQAVVTPEHPHLARLEPSKQGKLTFFANDITGWYWNNWGAIEVQVTRTD
jgi:hypothetical protein